MMEAVDQLALMIEGELEESVASTWSAISAKVKAIKETTKSDKGGKDGKTNEGLKSGKGGKD